jgi:hypothetical protein
LFTNDADLIREIVSISAFYFDQYLAKTHVDDVEVRELAWT